MYSVQERDAPQQPVARLHRYAGGGERIPRTRDREAAGADHVGEDGGDAVRRSDAGDGGEQRCGAKPV